MEEITQENKENLHQCKDDADDWCTVKIKSKSKRRARFKKKMESALEPIIENVSEDELYFSSSSEEEVQQQKTIELVLRPQKLNNSNNRNEENNNKLKRALGDVFSSRNDRNNKEFVRSPPEPHQCSIIDKLHQTLDKELIRKERRWNRGDCHDLECSECKKYQETVSGFVNYFERRHGIVSFTVEEKDLELLQHANDSYFKYKKPLYILPPKKSGVKALEDKVTPLLPNVNLVIPTSSSSIHPTVQSKDERFAPNVTRETKKNVTLNESNNSEEEKSSSTDSATTNYELIIDTEKVEKISKLEKRSKELSMRLQNVNDNLDSALLNSRMYSSKLFEFLDG